MKKRNQGRGWRLAATGAWALLMMAGWVVAENVKTQGALPPSGCQTYIWESQEGIPIYDPLTSPDTPPGREELSRLDATFRTEIEKELSKKKWAPVQAGSPACVIRYSLLQEIDLEVAPAESGISPPRSTDTTGVGMRTSGAASNMKRRGSFTLDILAGDPPVRVWRGTREGELGSGKNAGERALKFVREVVRAIPKP